MTTTLNGHNGRLGKTAAPPQPDETCPRFPTGSMVSAPQDLYSKNGVLRVHLAMRNHLTADGEMRYCYVNADGSQAPTLRLHPGDRLILSLKNELSLPASSGHLHTLKSPCGSAMMTAAATNLHFHGLSVPPVCHQDDVLHTLISPSEPPFEYRLQIPPEKAPGDRQVAGQW